MKQLSLTFGAQVQIYFCTTLDFILVLGAVLAWGSLKERTFQKAGDGWRWKVGCGINRSQAFSLYLNHVQFLMPTSDSKDPGQVWVFLSWPCLSGEAQPCLSFPHLTISGEQQLWDSGYYSAFSSGAIVLPGEQCFAAATWRDWTSTVDSVLGFPHPGPSMQQILWEGALQDWAAQQFFCMWWDKYLQRWTALLFAWSGQRVGAPGAHSLLGRKVA